MLEISNVKYKYQLKSTTEKSYNKKTGITGKTSNFRKCSGMRPRTDFSTRETTKPTVDNTKIQRDEQTNIYC